LLVDLQPIKKEAMSTNKSKNILRTLPLLLVILSLSCSLPGLFQRGDVTPTVPAISVVSPVAPTPAQPRPTPMPLPPAIVESDPPPGGELTLDGLLTLYFNQPMQRTSVEAALSLRPSQLGSLTWQDDTTLVISPTQPFAPQSTVTVTLDTGAQAANGLALPQPVQLEYRTAGYLRLTQALPEPGAYDVDPTSAIAVTFNLPIVPLGAETASQPPPFSIEPQPQGRGEWINTSTYIFYPDPPLEGGKTYTVRLNPDLHSLDGSPMESMDEPLRPANEWSFITATPRVAAVSPSTETGYLPLDATFVITYNQPMDPQSVESNFALLEEGKIPVQGKVTWDEQFIQMNFQPDNLLARDTNYTLSLDSQALAQGGTPLDESLMLVYTSVPPLAVTSSDPPPGGVKQNYQSVSLTFNAPVQDEDLKRYVSVEPEVTNFGVYWNPYDRQMYIDGDYLPSENYTLRISPELPDVWGGNLGSEFTLSFAIAPLPPSIMITNASEALFLTAQDNSLPAQVTNLSRLELSLGSTPLSDFIAMLSGENAYEYRRSYIPADQRSWQQTLEVAPNRSQSVEVYVSPERTPLPPGLYHLRFNNLPADVYIDPYLMVVSDVQVTFKIGVTDVLVWAVEMDDSTPLVDAPVSIYDGKGQMLASGNTNAEGVFYSQIPAIADPYTTFYAVVAQPGQPDFGMALSTWSNGINPWDFGISADIVPPRLGGYIYTDRPIYRPGQTIYFRAALRDAFNGRYALPELSTLPMVLYQDYGTEIARFDLPLSAYGTVHGEYTLSADAKPGYYRLTAEMPGELESPPPVEIYFQVAEYRKPEIDVQVEFTPEQAQSGDSLLATIQANYFFGAPAGDVPVEWTLTSTSIPFLLPGYQVGIEELMWLDPLAFYGSRFPFGRFIEQGTARTDAQGKLVLELNAGEVEYRQRYTLEVTLQDESGQRVSARDTLDVNPGEFYIGVRPDAWVGRSGEPLGFDVLVVDWEQAPAGVQQLRAEFQKVVWERQDPPPSDIYSYPTFTARYTPVGSTDFQTGADGKARLEFTPEEPGTFQLDVTQNGAHTAMILWVGGAGQAVWPNIPNQQIRLTGDRQEYLPGDTARVFVPNPFSQPAQVLVTLERGLILRHEVVTLPVGGDTIELPLSSEDAPNVYLSVTVLGKTPEGRPDFRLGYLNLPVKPVEQTFNVQVIAEPEQTGPAEAVDLELQVTDASGNPVQGEFSLSLVDRAALALADPNAIEIEEAFYGNQHLGIRTGVALAAYAWRQVNMQGGIGGGGGDGFETPFVRQEFEDTAYWNPEIQTDSEGRAQVSLTLPDNLTTWQVLARGLTTDTRVGQAESNLLTTKDLLVRPVVPRFLVAGDHVQLATIVQNNTRTELEVSVNLQSNGVVLDDPASISRKVTLPAGGRERLEWWGRVDDVPSVDLVFSAVSGELSDASRPANGALPVLRFMAPQTFSTAGQLDEAGERLELVSLPRSFNPDAGQLKVELAPSLAGSMFAALDVLEHYPYACTEQTVSRFLPNLETYRVLLEFGIDSPDLRARLDRTLQEGLQALLASQKPDGGWGWWSGGESDAYISAYVLLGFSRAQAAGISVADSALQRAIDYLRGAQYTPSMASETWQLDRQAFIQYALLQAGAGDLASAQSLFEVRDQLSPWAEALLMLTLEQLSPGSQSARTLASDLESTAIRSSTGVHWEEESPNPQNMTTPLSTSAMVVYALAQRDPGTPLMADAVRYLMVHRQANGAWDTTYGSAWTLMALSEVIKGTGELGGNYAFSASLNSQPLASGQAGGDGSPVQASVPISQLYPEDPNALLIERQEGNGPLYYTAALEVSRPVQDIVPQQRGVSIQRTYYPLNESCAGRDCAPIQGETAGELVQVRLALTLEQAAYYLLVEDYLPAGAEILDTSLKTSQQVVPEFEQPEPEPAPLYSADDPFQDGWGWWLFSSPQVYDERIAWSADYLPAGSYELTYTLSLTQPGEYQVLPARAWQFYFPDVQGVGAGTIFNIQP
jgi:hypothetical protein